MRATSIAFALLLLVAAPVARAELPATLSGSWYDAAHPGHGVSVEILDGDRAIAYWFVYDAGGAPLHLYIDGRAEGRSIVGDAYAGRGMRFGTFDPREHRLARWGTVRMRFDDCDSATLDYDADGIAGGASFGRGTIGMVRLATNAGLACAPNAFPRVTPGVYAGTLRGAAGTPRSLHGFVDPRGRFWATVDGGGPALRSVESPRYDGDTRVANAVLGTFAYPDGTPEPDIGSGLLDYGDGSNDRVRASIANVTLEARHDSGRTAALARPIDERALVNRVFAMRTASGPPTVWVRMTYDGYCFEYAERSTACGFRATRARFDAAFESFEFTLYAGRFNESVISEGVGWIEWSGTEPSRLVIVGSGGIGMVGEVLPIP